MTMQKEIRYILKREGYAIHDLQLEERLSSHDFLATGGGRRMYIHLRAEDQGQLNARTARDLFDEMEPLLDGGSYTGFAIVASRGFSQNAVLILQSQRIKLFVYVNGVLVALDDIQAKEEEERTLHIEKNDSKESQSTKNTQSSNSPFYLGVFAAKGGVGKTTISAHIAGQWYYSGRNVALLDLDDQGNLVHLMGEKVLIKDRFGEEKTLTIQQASQFVEQEGTELVVCDCSPSLKNNDRATLKKLDAIIIPMTLSPLGVNHKAKVLRDSLGEMKHLGVQAKHYYVLINQFHQAQKQNKKQDERNKRFSSLLKSAIEELQEEYPNLHYIDPNEEGIYIRHSLSLLYWGEEMLEKEQGPTFAFQKKGNATNDFHQLAEFLDEALLKNKASK